MNQDNERRQQYFEMDQEEGRKSSSSVMSLGTNRLDFIRKVYGILSVQLLFTVTMCWYAYTSKSFQLFQVKNVALLILFFVIGLIVEIAIICCQSVARKVPTNYICLGVFTFCESYIVSCVCSEVYLNYSKNGAELVFISALLTLGITLALTIYAFTTKTDFTTMGGVLFVCGMALMLLGLFTFIFNCPFLHLLYACFGAVLFGFYLIYDTQLVAGGKRNMLDQDDYIIGALIIYIDVIMLFLEILKILVILFGKKD